MLNLMVGCLSRLQEKWSLRKVGLGLSFFPMAGFENWSHFENEHF
jgi:hypothetical protein